MDRMLQLPSEKGDVPLYMQIADTLRRLIDDRTLKPGEKIPPTRELRDRFDVSTITVEAGLKVLVDEKYLVRHPRRGTFINPALAWQGARQVSFKIFSRSVSRPWNRASGRGGQPGTNTSTGIRFCAPRTTA